MSTATMTFSISTILQVMMDADTYWKRQIRNPAAGSLVNPVQATDTVLPISLAYTTAFGPGDALYLDGEEMTVQSVVPPDSTTVYSQVTVSRGVMQMIPGGAATQFPRAVPASHAAGSIVQVLQYASPWHLITDRYVRPGINTMIAELGPDSATLSAQVTGSAAINS